MIIKVCGMRDRENIRQLCQLPVDMMGMVFCPDSPRYVGLVSSRAGLTPDYSRERLEQLSEGTQETTAASQQAPKNQPKRVGVFRNEMPQTIITRIYNHQLDYVQLHGEETPTLIRNLRLTLDPDIQPGIRFIKAIGVSSAEDLKRAADYEDAADLLLFDTRCPEGGGSGRQFDWDLLEAYDGQLPFLLSGGIGPDDAEKVKQFSHPRFLGIDLNSRFETEPGVKNIELLKSFIDKVKGL